MSIPSLGRSTFRTLGAVALSSALVAGVSASPASATYSDLYQGEYRCLNAQRATGATSFVAITKRCYRTNKTFTIKEWGWTDYYWRFEYTTRY
jgi:hypothetical protein